MATSWYPVNLDLRGRRCLVVGAGAVAADKVDGLLEVGAEVVVVAPDAVAAITARATAGEIELALRAFAEADLDGVWYVVAATGDREVNAAVRQAAEARQVFVNAADDPASCTAILPSRLRRGRLLVTFSTGGASPALSKWLRREAEGTYGPEHAALTDLLAQVRRERQARGVPSDPRGWQRALDSGILDLVRQGRTADAKELLDACLSSSSA